MTQELPIGSCHMDGVDGDRGELVVDLAALALTLVLLSDAPPVVTGYDDVVLQMRIPEQAGHFMELVNELFVLTGRSRVVMMTNPVADNNDVSGQ